MRSREPPCIWDQRINRACSAGIDVYMGREDEQEGKREAVTKKILGLNVDIFLALPAPLIVVWSKSQLSSSSFCCYNNIPVPG